MEQVTNQIILRGTLEALPEFSHENHGKRFYRFLLEVPRLSGTADHLPVIVREEILEELDLSGGSQICATGQLRSFHDPNARGQKLQIFAYCDQLKTDDEEACNQVQLAGTIRKPPVFRRTPLGREICDVMLSVPRTYGRWDYLPCIFWGRSAQMVSGCVPGDKLLISGRLQSRPYRKVTEDGLVERTAYEVSALSTELCPQED